MEQKQRVVRTYDNKMVDTKDMRLCSLTDAFSFHARFIKASAVIISECCGPECAIPDGEHIECVLDEVETRIDYLEAIQGEMYARLKAHDDDEQDKTE